MGVNRSAVGLQYFDDPGLGVNEAGLQNPAAGLFADEDRVATVWLNVRYLEDPFSVVATMAHELGHYHLLHSGRLSVDEPDHEWVTDLLTVFLGLGVMTANSVVRSASISDGVSHSWGMDRLGYLGMREYGYALALFARSRGEVKPAWSRYLRPDVLSAFKATKKNWKSLAG